MIIPGEDPAELDQLTLEYEQHFQPVGPVESALVQTIVRAQWFQCRCDRIEAQFLNARVAALGSTPHALGTVTAQDAADGNTLVKMFAAARPPSAIGTKPSKLSATSQVQRRHAAERFLLAQAYPTPSGSPRGFVLTTLRNPSTGPPPSPRPTSLSVSKWLSRTTANGKTRTPATGQWPVVSSVTSIAFTEA